MNRLDILNSLITKHKYKSYLEIGVRTGDCINGVNCEYKVGVDPDPSSAATVHKTSDEFFENTLDKFDIIFIDGLHHSEQVIRDIENSLRVLKDGGSILMHDCLPTNKHMQEIPLTDQQEWTGDCWKAFVHFRQTAADLSMVTIDADWGCGLIRKGTQTLLKIDGPLTYEDLVKYKKDWMNVIPVSEFIKRYLV